MSCPSRYPSEYYRFSAGDARVKCAYVMCGAGTVTPCPDLPACNDRGRN